LIELKLCFSPNTGANRRPWCTREDTENYGLWFGPRSLPHDPHEHCWNLRLDGSRSLQVAEVFQG